MTRAAPLTAADVARCTHRVALERGSVLDHVRPELSVEIERRIREARYHREHVMSLIVATHPDIVHVDGITSTTNAMTSGARVIAHARLSDSERSRRVSTVDLLVRTSTDTPTYVPIIIKNNEVTESASTRRILEGSLSDLTPDSANWTGGVGVRKNDVMWRNGVALDHATRILQANGFGDLERRGGLVDRNSRLWWFDLENSEWGRWSLGRYDESFDERREILEGHDQWFEGKSPFPTTPYWHRECLTCPFESSCEDALSLSDDVSLVRFTNREQQILLREHGVQTRQQLAELNPVLARQVRGASAATVARSTEEHLGRSIDKLDELIYRARVAVAKSSLLICDPGSVSCPTADVEVDIDMESYDDVTYLWGALVTTRRSVAGVTDGYFPFVSWEPLTGQVESDVFRSFWQWFSDLSVTVRDAGANLAAYCFWAQAENSAMNRAASFDGDASLHAAISDFRRREPSEWIDLHDVIKHQIQTDGPLGLKKLAQATGFSWREANPSGEASMTWYEHAIESTNEAAILARTRLLEYNEDDCRATRALREWLNGDARQLAHRDEWP